MTNDGEMLLRAVLLDPEDDTVRLVYADWCEENGQEHRAAFIRDRIQPLTDVDQWHTSCADCRCLTCQVVRRDTKWAPWYYQWIAMKPFEAYPLRDKYSQIMITGAYWEVVTRFGGSSIVVSFARGFPAAITMHSAALFVEVAKEIFAHQPITRVKLRGTNPTHVSRQDAYCFNRRDIPRELRKFWPKRWARAEWSPGCKTPRLARSALSAACVAFGRWSAGLVPDRPATAEVSIVAPGRRSDQP